MGSDNAYIAAHVNYSDNAYIAAQEHIRKSIQRHVLLYKRRFPRTRSWFCDEYHFEALSK